MKPMMYIVMGSTGDYEDRTTWGVCAYTDKAMALAHVEAATKAAQAIAHQFGTSAPYITAAIRAANIWDPQIEMYTPGTTYNIMTVPLARRRQAVSPAPKGGRGLKQTPKQQRLTTHAGTRRPQ